MASYLGLGADMGGFTVAMKVPNLVRTLLADTALSAAFYFLRNDFAVEEAAGWEEVRDAWTDAVAGWLSIESAGVFPPLPHHRFTFAGQAAPRYCDACPCKDHCRVSPAYDGSESDPGAVAARVAGDPALRPVAAHRPARG